MRRDWHFIWGLIDLFGSVNYDAIGGKVFRGDDCNAIALIPFCEKSRIKLSACGAIDLLACCKGEFIFRTLSILFKVCVLCLFLDSVATTKPPS